MEPQQTLRANNATIKCILDTLDAKEIPSNEPQEPDDHRYSYRVPALRVELQQTNGSVAHVIVPTRKIGRDGVSFLVGRLVYPETSCRIDLITTHNHWQSVTGKVVGCKYVQGTGSIYEADVHFQQPIDIALFVAQALRVRVLLVDDSRTARDLLTQMLHVVNADVVTCENGQEGVEKALSQHFDLLLMDMEMPVLDGFQATALLRSKGYTQPIVAVTGLNSPGDRERCLQAGCDDYLAKPPTHESMAELVNRLRPEPLVSSLTSEFPELAKLIDPFVCELHQRAMDIQQAFMAADLAVVERAARALRCEAPGYGFEPIGVAAKELELALKQQLPASEVHVKVGKLVRLCCVARPSPVNAAS